MLRCLLRKDDWMTTIDLKDAFLSVPIQAEHRKLLRFQWKETLYEFQCLPFGLSSAPCVFTKLLRPVMAVLRRQGIRCMVFIDDLLILHQSETELTQITLEVVTMLLQLGFRVNYQKSALVPSRRREFLGFTIHSATLTLSLPQEKLDKIIAECSKALSNANNLSVRQLARLIGRMSAATQAILPAPLFYRRLQRLKNAAFRRTQSYDAILTLDQAARDDLQWWLKEVRSWNGKPVHPGPPQLTLESDASLLGWGARLSESATGGLWSQTERKLHINVLEMLAGTFAVKTFARSQSNIHVRLRMDNTAAVAYVNHMGGTRSSRLAEAARDLWMWCLDRGMTLSAAYLPGEQNSTADRYSRTMAGSAEWRLDPVIFQQVASRFTPITVDLFATRINAQLPHYVSWQPDPFAMAVDAFHISWADLQAYAFPPFCLLGRCLQKIVREQATIVLIAPLWAHQPWYPALLEALVDIPLLLPLSDSLLTDPFGQVHPLMASNSLRLAAWKVSGRNSLQRGFRSRLSASSPLAGVRAPTMHTSLPGTSGNAGVLGGLSIPFQLL